MSQDPTPIAARPGDSLVGTALRDGGYEGWLSAEVFPEPTPEAAAESTARAFKAYVAT